MLNCLPLIAIWMIVLCNGHSEEADAALQLTLKQKCPTPHEKRYNGTPVNVGITSIVIYCDFMNSHSNGSTHGLGGRVLL